MQGSSGKYGQLSMLEPAGEGGGGHLKLRAALTLRKTQPAKRALSKTAPSALETLFLQCCCQSGRGPKTCFFFFAGCAFHRVRGVPEKKGGHLAKWHSSLETFPFCTLQGVPGNPTIASSKPCEGGSSFRKPIFDRNCLQRGLCNLVDPSEWPQIGSLNRDFGRIVLISPTNNSKHRAHRIFFSLHPGNLLNLIFRDWPDPVSSD